MNLIKSMNTKSDERKASELKDKLEGIKYSRDEDICLIYIRTQNDI